MHQRIYQESVGEASVKCPCNHRLYWSIYTSVIISTKYRSRHWFLIGQLSVKYRSNVDWVMTDISTDTSAKMSIKAPHKMHDPFSLILYHHDIIIFYNFFVILYSILGEPLVCQVNYYEVTVDLLLFWLLSLSLLNSKLIIFCIW